MKKKIIVLIISMIFPICVNAQFYSLRTNMVGLGTGNLNLELSMTMNRKWSLHIPVQYNPFVFRDNKQFRNLTIEPAVRYWFVESYNKNFVSLYGIASRFHVGGLFGHRFRYDGKGFGAGLSYGHAYTLSSRFNIEWEVGAGLIWADYDKYRCKHCGAKIGSESKLYFLPTKIAVNIVYLF